MMIGHRLFGAIALAGLLALPAAVSFGEGVAEFGNTPCSLGTICPLAATGSYVLYPVDIAERGSNFACLVMAGSDSVQAIIEGANGFSFQPQTVLVDAGQNSHVSFDGFYTGDGRGEIRVRQEGTASASARVLCMARDS